MNDKDSKELIYQLKQLNKNIEELTKVVNRQNSWYTKVVADGDGPYVLQEVKPKKRGLIS